MKKSSKYILLVIIVLVLIVAGIMLVYFQNGVSDMRDYVTNKESAEKIATIICKDMYPEINMDQYYPSVEFDSKENLWIISYSRQGNTEQEIIAGGGGPIVYLSKKTSEVVKIILQK